jgi:hypothetical protein
MSDTDKSELERKLEKKIKSIDLLKSHIHTPSNVVLVTVDDIIELFYELQPYTMAKLDDITQQCNQARIDEVRLARDAWHDTDDDEYADAMNRRLSELQFQAKETE